jgi:hypothetical protein
MTIDVHEIGVEQVKSSTHLKEVVYWKNQEATTATDLQTSIDNLTSRIKALEATFLQMSKVPTREERAWVDDHSVDTKVSRVRSPGEILGLHPAQGCISIP